MSSSRLVTLTLLISVSVAAQKTPQLGYICIPWQPAQPLQVKSPFPGPVLLNQLAFQRGRINVSHLVAQPEIRGQDRRLENTTSVSLLPPHWHPYLCLHVDANGRAQ